MENHNNDKKKKDDKDITPIKPDPETLDTTDPQNAMKGPVSTLGRRGGKIMESNISKEEADKKHRDNL
ncbi:hypothetical protein PIECOFPK_01076 [Mycovorax composti]|mgnify:CR=1 FL=1|jgi:hypothetical protein|uniref:Uncharacterized protein n=2 Tax=Chitinophagaceae TaxID=563835 RepID=A0ABZ2EIQ1_9BACT